MNAQPSLLDWTPPEPPRFGGITFDAERDGPRLNAQAQRVYDVMKDGHWWTPEELERLTHYRWASISARIRDFRKPEFHVRGKVEREHVGNGNYRYRLVLNR